MSLRTKPKPAYGYPTDALGAPTEFGHYQHRWVVVEHKDDHTPIHFADDRRPERAKSEKWDGTHLITMDKVRLHRKVCLVCKLSKWRTCNCKADNKPSEPNEEKGLAP